MARFASKTLAAFVATVPWFAFGAAAAEDYKLQAGDRLEVTILGTEPLKLDAAIEADGKVRVPLGGEFQAAGRTLGEVRAEVAEALKKTAYPAGTDVSGNVVWNSVYDEGVIVRIVEYRPVYLMGDVLTPGSQPFRFGLTARQAAAVAGGYSRYRAKQDMTLELSGAADQRRNLLEKWARSKLKLARLQAELDDAPDLAFAPDLVTGLDEASLRDLQAMERNQFDARQRERDRQRVSLREAVKGAELRYRLLDQSRVNLEKETATYEAEAARVAQLLKKGLTQVDRLTNAQRAVFVVATRSLETSAEVARVERELLDLRASLDKIDADARLENLAERDATALLASESRAELDALESKMGMAGLSVSGSRPGGAEPSIRIVRQEGDETLRMSASEDVVLKPGDVVDVSLDPPAQTSPDADRPEVLSESGAGRRAMTEGGPPTVR